MEPPGHLESHAAGGVEDLRRDDCIALLAHELRNLLAPIRYALATLEKTDTTAQQGYALEVMRRQSTHMSRLLDDLLDVSRFSRGEFELRRSVTDLKVVLHTSIEAARPLLDAKQHSLAISLPDDALTIWADPVRLGQVFSNLLINAAKYTDRAGHIELRAVPESDSIVISVRDSGIGISSTMMPKVFTLFARDPEVRARPEGGLGIGLALVRGIVSLHGGTIQVHSDGPGHGSEFVVRLPSGAADVEPDDVDKTENPARRKQLRVLVVDDNQDVADSCSMLIKMSGHQVETVYTGKQAMETGESFRPHVILTDIGLPDIDGYQLAQRVRATSWGSGTVLVAITGWAAVEHQRQPLAPLFSHHLKKPIDPGTIESLLAQV
jgi:CheY-like chemotaxis protein/two-component sensor histidine kinase